MKKIKILVPYLIISIILIIGIMIKVYADYLYSSSDVYYENNSSTLTSTDLQSAIEELDTKCENRIADSRECPEGYKCTEIQPICKRATTLHTETCSQTSSYCYADGYYSSGSKGTTTITYGSLGTSGTLTSGDAFDCDVNGDGTFNASTERFYYVSDYFDTSTKTFDNDYAVFIYYSNTTSGTASTSNVAWYSSSNSTIYGPTTAMAQLPTTSQWRDDLLKSTTRNILGGSSGSSLTTTYKSNFSYSGYAARLLTMQELYSGCYDGSRSITTDGGLSTKCKYLMERTKYSTSSYATNGPWLESASTGSDAWNVYSSNRLVGSYSASTSSYGGARPAIEVLKSDVSY